MSRLTSQRDTEEIPAVAFTDEQITKGLTEWGASLTKARAEGDLLAEDTALRFIDCWLDRKLQAAR